MRNARLALEIYGLAAAFLLGLALINPAWADSANDRMQTTEVIKAQIAAFEHNDGAKAFSYASDDVKAVFQTPAVFLEMVKLHYPVVYHPDSVRFLTFETNGTRARHVLQMTDTDQNLWKVYYELIKDDTGAWKISSCQIEKVDAQQI